MNKIKEYSLAIIQLSRLENTLNKFGIFIEKYRDRTNHTVLRITKDVSTYDRVVKTNPQSNEEWLKEFGMS